MRTLHVHGVMSYHTVRSTSCTCRLWYVITHAHAACACTREIFVLFFHREGDRCAPINAYYSFCRNSEFSEFAIRFCVVGVQVPTFVKFLFMSKLSCRILSVCAPTFPELTTSFERPRSLVFPNVYMYNAHRTSSRSKNQSKKFRVP